MKLNLNDLFPLSAKTGKRGALPKQNQFMRDVLDSRGPQYVLYCGGVGSGKTLVGCITMIMLAVMYPGDYLIARNFAPELRDTTLAQFLDICPKELIKEHRVTDRIIRIKSAGGKISNILFRGLDEPDKLRSLNLSGFYIDESSQVSEEAFMMLQGRNRGPGLNKGILTTNPNGHDWQYKWFVKQDHFKPIADMTVEQVKTSYKLIQAPSTENIHLRKGYIETMMSTWSPERIKREIEGSFDAFEGMVYHEFRRDIHVVKPFAIPKEWTKIIGIDHGYRNPAAWVWGAVDYDDNVYIYREFYEREWLIEEICNGKEKENKAGVLRLMRGEKIDQARIDPSVKAVRGQTGQSDWDIYIENLPRDFPLMFANNEKTAGIDKVKSFLKINPSTNKPRLFIFEDCLNLIEEISRYRYKELTPNQKGLVSEVEEPRKVDDHALDALRYLIMSRPEAPRIDERIWDKIKYNSLEGALYRDLKKAKKPKGSKDPLSGLS